MEFPMQNESELISFKKITIVYFIAYYKISVLGE